MVTKLLLLYFENTVFEANIKNSEDRKDRGIKVPYFDTPLMPILL